MRCCLFLAVVALTGCLSSEAFAQGRCAGGGAAVGGGGTTGTGVVSTGLTGTGVAVTSPYQLAMQQLYLQQLYAQQQVYLQQQSAAAAQLAQQQAEQKERKLSALRQRRANEVARWSSGKSKAAAKSAEDAPQYSASPSGRSQNSSATAMLMR